MPTNFWFIKLHTLGKIELLRAKTVKRMNSSRTLAGVACLLIGLLFAPGGSAQVLQAGGEPLAPAEWLLMKLYEATDKGVTLDAD